jgi:anti-sigma factor RsiW
MSDAHDHNPPDEELVAYLDGELEPDAQARLARRIAADHELQRRLILLSGGNRPFREAFDHISEAAPGERLEAMLDSLSVPQLPAAASPRPVQRWRAGLRTVVASLLLFLAGSGAGWFMSTLGQYLRDQPLAESSLEDEWRQAVAQYLTLYTTETLASIPEDAAMREQEIAAVSAKLGIALTPQRISLPDLSFKRAQLLEYDRKPLGQLTYLDPASGPLALCIIMNDGSNPGQQTEGRLGFNIVYWSRGRHSFMLIGRVPSARLQGLASDLSDRLI